MAFRCFQSTLNIYFRSLGDQELVGKHSLLNFDAGLESVVKLLSVE
jgi:hypothetical protein